MCAEAACSSSVRLARSVVQDIGEKAASASGGLLDISRCSEANAERDTHNVLTKKYSLALDVAIDQLGTGILDVPVIRLRSWLAFLLKRNTWHIIAGLRKPNQEREEAILQEFWRRFQMCHGDHPIFKMEQEGKVCLRRCAPLLLHADEGRGRRRVPFLVSGFFSILGRGTHPADKAKLAAMKSSGDKVLKPYLKLRPNFKGHSFTTRFLQVP